MTYDGTDLDEFTEWAARHRANEDASFGPHESMERSALNLIGAYQNVLNRVNSLYYMHSHHPQGRRPEDRHGQHRRGPVQTVRLIAEQEHIRWPHDEFAVLYDRANKVRQRFAHMVWIDSVAGEQPHRTMILIVPDSYSDRQGWTDQRTEQVEVTEVELLDALASLRTMRMWLRSLSRLIYIFSLGPAGDRSGHGGHEMTVQTIGLTWWLREWGPRRKSIRLDELRTDI